MSKVVCVQYWCHNKKTYQKWIIIPSAVLPIKFVFNGIYTDLYLCVASGFSSATLTELSFSPNLGFFHKAETGPSNDTELKSSLTTSWTLDAMFSHGTTVKDMGGGTYQSPDIGLATHVYCPWVSACIWTCSYSKDKKRQVLWTLFDVLFIHPTYI